MRPPEARIEGAEASVFAPGALDWLDRVDAILVEVHGDQALSNITAACPETLLESSRSGEKLLLIREGRSNRGGVRCPGPTPGSAARFPPAAGGPPCERPCVNGRTSRPNHRRDGGSNRDHCGGPARSSPPAKDKDLGVQEHPCENLQQGTGSDPGGNIARIRYRRFSQSRAGTPSWRAIGRSWGSCCRVARGVAVHRCCVFPTMSVA